MSKLLALHNITETKLKGVLELGAFPMPSLAITMDEFPYQSFGDITFVFKKSAVDPLVLQDAMTCMKQMPIHVDSQIFYMNSMKKPLAKDWKNISHSNIQEEILRS